MARRKYTKEQTKPATILNGAALSEVVGYGGFEKGILRMPAAWTAASIAFQVSNEITGTFLPLQDEGGTLVELTVAVDEAFPLPIELAGALYFKLWSETGGTGVNQGANRAIFIDMK